MSAGGSPPQRPQEVLPIPLFDGVVLAVRSHDGTIWLCLLDLCEVLNLNLSAQRRRIELDPRLHLTKFHVPRGNQVRALDFVRNDDLPIWIMLIPLTRIGAERRARFGYVQTYLSQATQRAFAELTGLPSDPGQRIEDIQDLDRMEQAFQALAVVEQRQRDTEVQNQQDHQRLETLLTDLRQQLQQLAHEVRLRIAPEQRFTIDQLVQAWAEAVATTTATAPGTAKHRCWKQLNTAFGVTTYTDLPAARYDEIISYLKDCYRTTTGREIDAVAQERLL